VNFHDAIRSCERFETELRVQGVRVASRKQHSPKTLKVGVSNDLLHETTRKSFTPMLWKNVHVRKVCERCLVSYDAGKPNLSALAQNTETERIRYRTLDDRERNARRPIGLGEEAVNRTYVESRFVARDFVWSHAGVVQWVTR
jgi:hypothetical protein